VANLPTNIQPGGTGETAIAAMAAKAQALVQARYEVAFHRPRDFDQVREKLLKECKRPSFAEVAEYEKPIGDSKVRGPSIRMAEAAIRCMTNLVISTSTIYDDPGKRIVNVSIVDLESNVPYDQDVTIEKSVERRNKKEGDLVLRERLNSKGQKLYILQATDDEILNKQNALISKALRTQALRLVPGDLIDEAMEVAYQTRKNTDAQDPDTAKRKIYDSFGSVGVGVEQIKQFLGHDGTTLTPKELQTMRTLFTALRDNETTWREIMDTRDPPPTKDAKQQQRQPAEQKKPVEEQLLDAQREALARMQAESFKEHQAEEARKRASARDEQEHVKEAQAARAGRDPDEAPPEPEQKTTVKEEFSGAGEGRITFNEICHAIRDAKTAKEIDDNIIPMIPEIPNINHQKSLRQMATNKKESLLGRTQDAADAKPQAPKEDQPNKAAPAQPGRVRRNVDMD
jgi:hypothetical protein